ncbi:DUF4435 domain-containing protein [Alkalibaculum sp. M08DMB]|uniref:DUF4435 domain-containing protein n=1 Tax=Alkalibaculum sporogenes TaxID=2655001 RepID=A0A6A7K819_9FIRM|nr:DUF4435 domain-containing protein [Alkalibaculum sporogenes]MPW25512.1 DUF4435 domain-containing protein [Alkalibaculum sporogenes]
MNIQEIKDAREKGVTAYTRFCLDKEYHNKKIFCFFEGEDYKYYNPRIEKYMQIDYHQIIYYSCGGRREVLKVHRKIKKDEVYNNVKKVYFIDRDFVPECIEDFDVYQTPCYSIENFYTSLTSFKKILNREFGINIHEKDFEKCVNDFEKVHLLFHETTKFLNAWICGQRKFEKVTNNKNVLKLREFKIASLFNKINIDNIECKCDIDLEKVHEKFPNCEKIPSEKIEELLINFKDKDLQQIFRGKFELDFLKKIIEDLVQKNNDRKYFEKYRVCISINPYINTLSSLNEYADTPDCLIKFLKSYTNTNTNSNSNTYSIEVEKTKKYISTKVQESIM